MDATDAALCAAFERIESARGEIPLTYFEFGTLAAFDQFARAGINVAVLEVGLGGRLDAVNAIDADAAMVASIGIDHVQWLGDTREAIGREKAGVFRKDRPAICADPAPPASIAEVARETGARLYQRNRDFPWSGRERGMPTARGEALSAVGAKPLGWTKYHLKLGETIPLNPIYSEPAAGHGVPGASYVRGCRIRRCAAITSSTTPPAHFHGVRDAAGRAAREPGPYPRRSARGRGPGALPGTAGVAGAGARRGALPGCRARAGADAQSSRPSPGRTLAVFGMLRDKDMVGTVRSMPRNVVDAWYVTTLGATERGATAEGDAGHRARGLDKPVTPFNDARAAYAAARQGHRSRRSHRRLRFVLHGR